MKNYTFDINNKAKMADHHSIGAPDGYMYTSVILGIISFISQQFTMTQVQAKYQWLVEHQPLLTAGTSILAMCAALASIYAHLFKKKK